MDTDLWFLKGATARRLRDQSFAEGFAEGFIQGHAEACAQRIASILEERGIEISEADRRTLLACGSMGELNFWFEDAKSTAWVNEVQAAHEGLMRRIAAESSGG